MEKEVLDVVLAAMKVCRKVNPHRILRVQDPEYVREAYIPVVWQDWQELDMAMRLLPDKMVTLTPKGH